MALTQDEAIRMCGFNQTALDHFNPQVEQLVESITVTGTALSRNVYSSELAVSGTMTGTLAAPENVNDRKRIVCISAASTPVYTLTISSPDTTAGLVTPATVVFTAVGQALELRATSALKWRVVGGHTRRAGVQVLVIGTTVTTGMVMAHTYSCSVTGTVSSTTTKSLPDGLFPGDICYVGCSTAATSPIGNINFTGLTLANVAATDLQAIGATTDTVTLAWTGTAWLVVANSGITVA